MGCLSYIVFILFLALLVVRKELDFFVSKLANGNLVETSKIAVADRDTNWGDFGMLECPARQAAMGIRTNLGRQCNKQPKSYELVFRCKK